MVQQFLQRQNEAPEKSFAKLAKICKFAIMKRVPISAMICKIFLTVTVLLSASCMAPAVAGRTLLPRAELKQLNEVMKNAQYYRDAELRRIDSLVSLARKASVPQQRFRRYMEIGKSYRTFMADSSLYYFMRAQQQALLSGDISMMRDADIAIVGAMSVAGFFNEASLRLDSLEKLELTRQQKLGLWMSARQLFSSMMTYVGEDSPMAKIYRDRYLAIDDSLLLNLPKNSLDYRFINAERLVNTGQYRDARQRLLEILDIAPSNDNIYGMAAYQLALVSLHQGDGQQYAAYLARAATSDIMGCVTEGWALPMLAKWLYQNDELDLAFSYINYSLSEAMSGNARMRSSVIAAMVPAIDDAYRKNLTSSRDWLLVFLCAIMLMFVITVVLIMVLWRQVKRSRITQRKLTESNRMRELYLGNFVGLCSTYSTKLQSLQKMVMRKISSGQTDDLLKTLKTGKISDGNEDFYNFLDRAFLEIFPHFVEDVNVLLRPEEQIHLRKEGTLSPELRIYALIRLGVDESSRIANILQYSANTVYAYRNKMRNKAIDRDAFEQRVRNPDYS